MRIPLLFATALLLALPAWAGAKLIPSAPRSYVLDEPQVLSEQARSAVSELVIEHDRATGEQVVVAIFKSLDGEDLVDYTARVFKSWKIGQKGKDNGVLLALYWDDHKARIEVGYGLEPLLTDAKSKDVLEEILIPGLKQRETDAAIVASIREILRIIGSPVVQNAPDAWRPDRRIRMQTTGGQTPWLLFLIFGGIPLVIVLRTLLAAEAHYSSRGWHRVRPTRRGGPWSGGWGGGFGGGGLGGGGFGGWGGGGGGGGDGGGFLGGGGQSGGGGASGGW